MDSFCSRHERERKFEKMQYWCRSGEAASNGHEEQQQVDLTLRLGLPQYDQKTNEQYSQWTVRQTRKPYPWNDSYRGLAYAANLSDWAGPKNSLNSSSIVPDTLMKSLQRTCLVNAGSWETKTCQGMKVPNRNNALMGAQETQKRCSKCNNYDTPMWRKGPLGPKSLCNACGIKYRKDGERRKAEELVIEQANGHNR